MEIRGKHLFFYERNQSLKLQCRLEEGAGRGAATDVKHRDLGFRGSHAYLREQPAPWGRHGGGHRRWQRDVARDGRRWGTRAPPRTKSVAPSPGQRTAR